METSIATVCLSGGLSEKLSAIAAAGFRTVEIFESDVLSYNGTPADIAEELKALNLKVVTFQPFRDFEGMPEPQRQRAFDRAERKFDLMQALGFHKAAQHKSKDVARWTQGAINLVINKEKEGFAHSHYITHGPSVCAIGLKVDDAAAAIDRAEKLHDTPFRQKVGPGELEIPAVRGMGGSLLYFLDPMSELGKVWDIEFEPVAKDGANPGAKTGAGLTTVDHISQSTYYEDMLSWLLFYTSLLDVRKTPQVDINDPGGVVRSQVVKSEDGALRIPMNGSQSQRTQSSRFLNEYFGAGVQHIAFNTSDIVATAERFKANGVPILEIPENYYDDLEARVDLPAARLAVLKANNILYDKDADGEYMQIYTRSFNDLFFLEIVERRGYKGFGAINAPIRLNAQSRLAPDAAL